MAKRKRGGALRRIIISLLLILFIGGGIFAYLVYRKIYKPNVFLGEEKTAWFYVYTGSTFRDVADSLQQHGYIKNRATFEWVAGRKNYPGNIKPGRYLLKAKMSNNELVNLLRSGRQTPLMVNFNAIRFKEDLAGKIGRQLEADSIDIITLLNDGNFLREKYGMTPQTILTMFIPDTYEFFWNTSAEQFLDRMAKIYKDFWTEERKAKARKMGMSQSEIITLASIVQGEQSKWQDEKPVVAGLYINRLKKGMRLESDPTLVYANRIFGARRVLKADKNIDSPYNTYKYKGLPPGPVNLPHASTIDAVLNYQPNDYLFMVAKDDFSGRHYFAKTYAEHQRYAAKYRKALNKRGVMR